LKQGSSGFAAKKLCVPIKPCQSLPLSKQSKAFSAQQGLFC
jgi:hypothetical protein